MDKSDQDKVINILKASFSENFKNILKNTLFSLKDKVTFILFFISPKLYDLCIRVVCNKSF